MKLANQIVMHKCTYNCSLKKLEIKLKKAIENFNWISLESPTG
jgi:hypothetical protein